MATIAYVDHSFHAKTLSTDFLPDILRRHGHTVDYFWDHAWNGGDAVQWDEVQAYDVVIMFQAFCPIGSQYYCQLHPNVVFIPMLDQFGIWQGPVFNLSNFWEPFQGSKVLNFSNALHCLTTGFGIASFFARYYQPTRPEIASSSGLHGFFWLRREDAIPWQTISTLIAKTAFDSFHIHLASDPGSPTPEPPSAADFAKHHITTSTWFDKKADFNALVERANVFFAARMEEGIGQSFLEALARGQCVVAPDNGTMNEYIIHGVNGLLYDGSNPTALDFSRSSTLGRQGREGAIIGRSVWEQKEAEIVEYILTPSDKLYKGKYRHDFVSTPQRPYARHRLRDAAKKYTIFRKTRFLWHPVKRLLSQLLRG